MLCYTHADFDTLTQIKGLNTSNRTQLWERTGPK